MTDINKLTVEIPALKLCKFLSGLSAIDQTLGDMFSVSELLDHKWIIEEIAKQVNKEDLNSLLVAFKLEMANLNVNRKG